MTEVLRYDVGSGTVLVEVDENSYGWTIPPGTKSWSAAAVSPLEQEEQTT
jgi:hypothetical protein